MTAIPTVTFSDVDGRYLEGDLGDRYDQAKVITQIQDAVDFALSRWRARIESRLASGVLTSNLYRRTIANAVLCVLKNPEGYTGESDGGYSYGLRKEVASGELGFTDKDIENLTGLTDQSSIGTIGVGLDKGWG